MRIDRFYRGEWLYEDVQFIDWGDDEDQEDFFEKNGFSGNVAWGIGTDQYQRHLNFYESNKENNRWLVDFSFDDNTCYFLIINDVPSLLMFLKEYKSVFEDKITDFVETPTGLINKRFIKKVYIDRQYGDMCDVIADLEDGGSIRLVRSNESYSRSFMSDNFTTLGD